MKVKEPFRILFFWVTVPMLIIILLISLGVLDGAAVQSALDRKFGTNLGPSLTQEPKLQAGPSPEQMREIWENHQRNVVELERKQKEAQDHARKTGQKLNPLEAALKRSEAQGNTNTPSQSSTILLPISGGQEGGGQPATRAESK